MERSYPIPREIFAAQGSRTKRDKASLVQRADASATTQVCDTCASLSCEDGYSCVQTQPIDFDECPYVRCEASENIVSVTGKKADDNKTEVGPIVGGVVGGLAFIAILTYLVWRFCIKPKRQGYAPSTKLDDTADATNGAEAEKQFAQRRDQRSSTHTVHSIASTVLTRASNIIQIAYIPGVTNRATPTSPGVLVPPVPPIPLALSSNANSPSPYEEPHFFVPGDLRDSTYSGFSGYTDRTSYARTSYAARTSMAPSIASAIISPPPITGIRGKAAIVSLKSNSGSSGSTTPPVPSIDYEKYAKTADQKPPPSPGAASTFSVGSTFLNNASASTATQARPQIIRVTSKHNKVNPLNIVKKVTPSSPLAATDDGEHLHPPVRGSTNTTARDSAAVTIIDDTPVDQSPFSDPPSAGHKSTTSLSAVIEEATRRAARPDTRQGETSRERSPFSDDNAMKE